MLRADHLSVAYGAHRALEDVSVKVERGEICVILGANGAGKTTLLKAIAGLVAPAPGARVSIGDTEITGAAPNRVVEAGVALVPEGRGIFGDLSVSENLALGAYGRRARVNSAARMTKVVALFPRLGERASQIARTMSGGEQQMVAIGRALMSNPSILMLDEPSLGLSPLLCAELFRSLKEIGETGVGILLVEQNARLSLGIADRAYLIENGRIVGEGRASALANDPAVQKAYLGGAVTTRQRRFSEAEAPVAPMAAAATAEAPADLATRATAVLRAHLAARRGGPSLPVNGRQVALADVTRTAETLAVSPHTADLGREAVDMARRAGEILAAHVAARRRDAHPPTLALPAPTALAVAFEIVASETGGKAHKKSRKKAKHKLRA